jgi:hypothetical protein
MIIQLQHFLSLPADREFGWSACVWHPKAIARHSLPNLKLDHAELKRRSPIDPVDNTYLHRAFVGLSGRPCDFDDGSNDMDRLASWPIAPMKVVDWSDPPIWFLICLPAS